MFNSFFELLKHKLLQTFFTPTYSKCIHKYMHTHVKNLTFLFYDIYKLRIVRLLSYECIVLRLYFCKYMKTLKNASTKHITE